MSVHNGHRQRMRGRYLKEGLDGFEEHQVLELILFYCIARKDTNELAHRLIKRFGSLAQVLEAPADAIAEVEGVGSNVATYLSLLRDFTRYYQVNSVIQNKHLRSIEDCYNYLKPYFDGRTVETVYMLSLDAKTMVLNCRMLGEGGINSAGISVRDVVKAALEDGATSVVLAHNHPSGIALPSIEDVAVTRQLARALQSIDVQLADHIILVRNDYTSIASSEGYKDALIVDDTGV